MSLAEAINAVLRIRGLTRKQLLNRLPKGSSPWAVYRILAGKSVDPRISTVLAICHGLDISLTELMQLAGAVPKRPRGSGPQDVRLRQAFRVVQSLTTERKELAIQQIEALLNVLRQWRSPEDR